MIPIFADLRGLDWLRVKHDLECKYVCLGMMMSSNGTIFQVTGPLCGEFTGHGQWRGALMFFLNNAWINNWVNNREAANLRCHRAHYDATVMDAWRSANMMIFSVHPSLHVTQQSGLASKVKTNTRPTGEVSATAVTDLRGRIDVIQTPGLYNVKAIKCHWTENTHNCEYAKCFRITQKVQIDTFVECNKHGVYRVSVFRLFDFK